MRAAQTLPKPREMEPDATVIIPFDDWVIFVGLLNRAEFSGGLPKSRKPFDPISRIQLLARGTRYGKRRLFGLVRKHITTSWAC